MTSTLYPGFEQCTREGLLATPPPDWYVSNLGSNSSALVDPMKCLCFAITYSSESPGDVDVAESSKNTLYVNLQQIGGLNLGTIPYHHHLIRKCIETSIGMDSLTILLDSVLS
jgi:hypothetical protein